jgi:type IV secretion system protein VirB4
LGDHLYGRFLGGLYRMKALNTLYAPHSWHDDRTYRTKCGELVNVYRFQGIPFECTPEEQLEAYHERLQVALLSVPDEIRIKFYQVKLDTVSIPRATHPNPVVERTIERRADYLENRASGKLCTIEAYLALVYEPERPPFSWRKQGKLSRKNLDKARVKLSQAEALLTQSVGSLLGLEILERREIFRFLAFLTSLNPEMAQAAEGFAGKDVQLDKWISLIPARTRWNGLRLGSLSPIVLSLDTFPAGTYPNVLRETLSIPGRVLVASEWKPEPVVQSVKKLGHRQTHFDVVQWVMNVPALLRILAKEGSTKGEQPDIKAKKDKRRVALEVLKLREHKENRHGWFGLTAICFSADPEENEKAAVSLQLLFANQMGRLLREYAYAYGPFLNLVPGLTPQHGRLFRQRVRKLPLAQFLDLAPVHQQGRGEAVNPVTNRPALLQLVTNDNTVFDFNLIPKNAALTGCLVIGVQGSGKSTFLQACIDHSIKDDPYTLILDGYGGSYRTLTEKHGGSYLDLNPETEWPFRMAPFSEPVAPQNLRRSIRYLTALIETMFATGGYKKNAESTLAIYHEVQRILKTVPTEKRRLSLLDLPKKLECYLAPWIGDAPNAHLFDNEEDTFSIQRFQCVDFAQLLDFPELVQPLLFHLFYRWNQIVNDDALLTTPKNLWGDENWQLLRFKTARRYLTAGMRTYRKRLGGDCFSLAINRRIETGRYFQVSP